MTPNGHDITIAGLAMLPDGQGGSIPCPELMTQAELIRYLRIPEISKARDYDNVVDNLKRMHDLPCIHVSGRPLYPLEAVRQWVRDKMSKEFRK